MTRTDGGLLEGGEYGLCSERWQCGALSDAISLQRGDEGRAAEKMPLRKVAWERQETGGRG